MSEDPARDGGNWFLYCQDGPVSAVDPDGRYPITGPERVLVAFTLLLRLWVQVPAPGKGRAFPTIPTPIQHEIQHTLEQGLEQLKRRRRWLKAGDPGGKLLGVAGVGYTSIELYLQQDPFGFASVMLDLAGEHEAAAQLDGLNPLA